MIVTQGTQMFEENLIRHGRFVQEAQIKIEAWNRSAKVRQGAGKRESCMIQDKAYLAKTPDLNLRNQKKVLTLDFENKTAWVEPGMTMSELVEAFLPYGLIPPVVPEFKGITVGGAIQGAAIESSSFHYGQFNDICLAYELLLGDGTVIEVSPDKTPELFWGVSGTYGTLGFILSVKLRLIETLPFLKMKVTSFFSVEAALSFMETAMEASVPPFGIEAIIYDASKVAVIEALPLKAPEQGLLNLSSRRAPWFFGVVEQGAQKQGFTFCMKVEDYLFRHDRGAFWMGGYACHPTLLLKYGWHKLKTWCGIQESSVSLPYVSPQAPSWLFRFLFGSLCSSSNLYKSLHGKSEKWFQDRFVIQDFYLAFPKVQAFLKEIEAYGITPLWLCPVKATRTSQVFAPHYSEEKRVCDIGVYGIPRGKDGKESAQAMEQIAYRLGGKKMFYAKNYLSKQKMWEIYPKEVYNELRSLSRMEGVVPSIEEKLLP